jgi:selenocysteine-specific elongation factor
VIALTKTDAVSEERIAEVTRELRTLLAGSFLADAPLFPCSAVKGQGIDALKTFLQNAARTWHAQRSAQRIANKNFRLAVDRSFSIEGRGTIITGTVHAGALAVGDTVRLLPSNRNARPLTARVRGLHAFNQPADRCEAGERVALNLVGVERSEIHRGDWIVDEALSHRTDRLSVVVTLLPDAKPLKHWSSVHMHTGAAHTLAHIALLEGDQLSPGSSMLGELALDVPLHLCQGDRIVLRDASARQTLGGCVVVDGFPPLRGKRSEQRLALLRAQQDSDDAHALKALLAMEARGINLSAFAANRNIRPTDLPLLLAQLHAVQVPTGDGLYACLPSHWQAIQNKIVDETALFHEREPDNAGVERERLRRKTFPTLAPEAFAAALQGLLEARTIVPAQGRFVALPTHKVEFSASERSVWEQVLPKLTEAPYQPPRVRPLAQELGLDEAEMRRLMGKSARLGYTYRVAHDHYFLASAVKDLAAHIAALCDEQGLAKAAPFRDRIDTGRKLAIQILEFFDTIGYTRRIKEHHMIRQPQMWS